MTHTNVKIATTMNKITLGFFLAKNKLNSKGLLTLFVLLLSMQTSWGQLFQQQFGTTLASTNNFQTTTGTYCNSSPTNAQFNSIGSSNTGLSYSVPASTQKLTFIRTGNAGAFSRTSDFSPTPSVLIYRFDIAVTGTTTATSSIATFQVGSGYSSTTNAPEANADTYARFSINTTTTNGTFVINDISNGSTSANLAGTQTITWVLNNSGSSSSYKAPDGTNETIANDKADIWAGTTRLFNDVAVQIASQTMTDLKFAFSGSSCTIELDNMLIDPIQTKPTSSVATSVTASGFTANWTAVTGATGYRLDVATDSGFSSLVSGYSDLYVSGQSTAAKAVTGLSGGTPYYYRVRAVGQYTVGEFASGNSDSQNPTTSSSTTPSLAITANTTAAFGSVCTNASPVTKTFTITNTGTAASNVVVTSSNAQYVVGALSSTDVSATNGTVTFDVTYTPSSGSVGTTLTSKYDTSTASGTLGLTGTAVTPITQEVLTSTDTPVLDTTATLNGNYSTAGVCPATSEKGFVYAVKSTNANPLVSGTGVTQSTVTLGLTGTYLKALTGLTPATTYTYKAYVYDGTTYTYGAATDFTTLAAQTITFGELTPVTYGGSTFDLTGTASSGLTVSYASTNTAVATVSGSTVTIVGAGSTNITASQAGNVSYNAATNVIQVLTVNKKALTLTDPAATSRAYNALLTTTITGTLTGIINADNVTLDGTLKGTFADANVANGIAVTSACNLAGTKAGNYTLTQPTGLSANITQASQTITFPALASKTTADTTPYSSGATSATSGVNALAYTSSNTNVATIHPTTGFITIAGAGSTTITVSQPGNTNYTAAANQTQILTVTLTPVSIFANTISGTNPNTSNPYTTSQTTNANITVSGIGRGSGIAGTNANDRYNANDWSQSNLDSTDYFQFTLTPNSGYKIDLSSFVYNGQASGTGPTNVAFRSSADSYSANIGTATVTGTTISLAAAAYQNITSVITFRFYAWGATGTGGTYSINDFIFNGNLVCATPAAPTVSDLTVTYDGAAKSVTASVGAATNVDWYADATSGTALSSGTSISPTNTNIGTYTYYAEARNTAAGCSLVSASRTKVIITIEAPTSTTWSGSAWSNGAPSSTVEAIIAGNYSTTTNGAFSAKKLTVNANQSLTINSGTNVTVQNAVINNGTLVVENNANLIQVNNVANTGTITVKRDSNALKRGDYTLWSSPVASQNLAAFSPLTSLNPNRFYIYNPATNFFTNTVIPLDPLTTNFSPGVGYAIRMPNEKPGSLGLTTPYYLGNETLSFPGVFTGIPNNGTINVIDLTANTYNAVGNPYPSTLDAALFLSGNSTDGVLYFWRKTNGTANTTSAYATWTTLGSAAGSNVAPNNIAPDGKIAVGQGFIVKTGAAATTLSFTNAMRTENNSAQFFKTKQVAQKDRVWLNLTNTSGAFSQTLIGYVEGATTDVDNGIDGKYINDSPIALTSSVNNEEYTIQGRPAFDVSDVVALNFKTNVAGEYTIAIDHSEGVFASGQDIYLVDSKTGTETNLKNSSYTFAATAAVDNARLSLKFQKTLSADAAVRNDNSVLVYKNNGTIYVNSGAKMMNNIKVFDIQGKLIAEQKNVKTNAATISNLKVTNQALIVQITSEDNKTVYKKVLN